jgi:tetratricopeptide (TPR) repeat protein
VIGKKTRWTLAAVGVALGLTLAGSLLRPSTPDPAPVAGNPATELTRFTEKTRERLTRVPGDAQAWADLGMAHIQLARITADPAQHALAEEALRRSLELRPAGNNEPALTGLSALAAARHDFVTAQSEAAKAVAADQYSPAAHGALADALIELGRYDEGFAAVQRMTDLRPDAASYARASYTFELRGNLPRARELMDFAVQVADGSSETAFALQHLAELAVDSGDLTAASAAVERGLSLYPGYAPLLASRAKLAVARGDLPAARADLVTVTTQLPLPGYLAGLAEILRALDDPAGAGQQEALLRAAIALSGPDIDGVLFEADHGDAALAVSTARELYTTRPSIGVADALAWSLHRAGLSAEALGYADRALALGTQNALMFFHRGIIHQGLGNRDQAVADLMTALRLNPHFSVTHAPTARAALAELGGAA